MTFEQFDRRAREIFDSIPPELRRGVAYLQLTRDELAHPTLPDVYTLGECATGEYDVETGLGDDVRSGVHLYYGSFRALAELRDDFDWEGELWETITHEVRHHRESAAGEDDLEDTDYAEDENFKRREGEPFDPLFYRLGEPVDDGAWEVDGDLFVEVELDEREFAATPTITAMAAGSEWSVARPAELGDVLFCYVTAEDEADVVIVLVRRRGGWEAFRALFSGGEPRVLESWPE
ncbi:MAG TPA: hypothetical protein VE913_03750 [Longimicrobium sp.]|nr:hypothetical protein [Longimicrobium sp.]